MNTTIALRRNLTNFTKKGKNNINSDEKDSLRKEEKTIEITKYQNHMFHVYFCT